MRRKDANEQRARVDQRRRRLLQGVGLALPLSLLAPARGVQAKASAVKSLSFYHTHTGENLSLVYCEQGVHLPDALQEVNHLLRDFRTGEQHPIDPSLLDLLHFLREATSVRGPFEVISGYRSPQTNAKLRSKSKGVAKRSLHMLGKAIDVRLTGFDTGRLRDLAVAQKAGGVGYYRRSDFVHLDTGRVRTW